MSIICNKRNAKYTKQRGKYKKRARETVREKQYDEGEKNIECLSAS